MSRDNATSINLEGAWYQELRWNTCEYHSLEFFPWSIYRWDYEAWLDIKMVRVRLNTGKLNEKILSHDDEGWYGLHM